MKWTGTVVGIVTYVEGLGDKIIYLIKTDDGDRIWRYEDEMDFAPGVPRRKDLAEKRA